MISQVDWPKDRGGFRAALMADIEKRMRDGLRAYVRFVVMPHTEGLAAAFGRIDISQPGDPPKIESRPCGPVTLLEWQPSTEAFLASFRKAVDGNHFDVNGQVIVGHGLETLNAAYRHDCDRSEFSCTWPLTHAVTEPLAIRPEYSNILPAEGPAVTFDGLDDAVRSVCGFGGDRRDAIRNSHLLIWDYRGRINDVRLDSSTARIIVEPPRDDTLRLMGSVTTVTGRRGVDERAPATLDFNADDRIRRARFELKLGEEVLDERLVEAPLAVEQTLARPAKVTLDVSYGRNMWQSVEALSEGGQGTTEKVRHIGTQQLGVLKTLKKKRWKDAARRDKGLERLRREITVLQDTHHPCVLKVLDADTAADEPWMVTEFMPLGSIHDHLASYKGDAWRTLRVARDIAGALAILHGHDLIHRDVKPGNIFLSDLDHAVLGDFGLVHDPEADTLTSTEEDVGSFWFKPPEAMHGRVDDPLPSFDIYSLGKVVWVMLAGAMRNRFEGEDFRGDGHNLASVLHRPELEAVNGLLDHMIVKDAASRLQSMEEVVDHIDRVLGELFGGGDRSRCPVCQVGTFKLKGQLNPLMHVGGQALAVDAEICGACGEMRLAVKSQRAKWRNHGKRS